MTCIACTENDFRRSADREQRLKKPELRTGTSGSGREAFRVPAEKTRRRDEEATESSMKGYARSGMVPGIASHPGVEKERRISKCINSIATNTSNVNPRFPGGRGDGAGIPPERVFPTGEEPLLAIRSAWR